MEDQAINGMQRLGWLSEKLAEWRSTPRIGHIAIDKSRKTADMLRADIRIEQEVAAEYGRLTRRTEESEPKGLLLRIRDHGLYQADVFGDLLKKEEERKGPD
jgi:bacterioferritin